MAGFWIVLGIIAWVAFAFWPASIAKKKGYSFILFLLLALVISWPLALIVALLLTNKNETAQDRANEQAAQAALDKETGEV